MPTITIDTDLLNAAQIIPAQLNVARCELDLRAADIPPAELAVARAKLELRFLRKLLKLQEQLRHQLFLVQGALRDCELVGK